MSETLGRYRLLKRIAAGGMAEIWLAKQAGAQGFEKLVVVKRILEHLAHDEQFVEMFLDEARLAALLAHPNIVQIFDLGGDEGGWYIAMEHIHGENLRAISRRRQLNGTPGFPLSIAARVASHTCQALHYAHAKKALDGSPLNIVHRDVSPQNILVSYEGQVKVVDFGIAKAATQNQITRTGVIKGKFAYMSPEQCLGKKLDGRSDQFAVGTVLWELLTGSKLFERENEILTFRAITEDEAPPPRSVNPEIPEELEAVVMRALRRDPKERYPDCQEMHLDLERFLQRAGELVSPLEIAAFMESLFQDRLESWREVAQLAREDGAVDSGLLEGRSDLFEMSLTPSCSKVPPAPRRVEEPASGLGLDDLLGEAGVVDAGAAPLSPDSFGAAGPKHGTSSSPTASTKIATAGRQEPAAGGTRREEAPVPGTHEAATRLVTSEELESGPVSIDVDDESTRTRKGSPRSSRRKRKVALMVSFSAAAMAALAALMVLGPGTKSGESTGDAGDTEQVEPEAQDAVEVAEPREGEAAEAAASDKTDNGSMVEPAAVERSAPGGARAARASASAGRTTEDRTTRRPAPPRGSSRPGSPSTRRRGDDGRGTAERSERTKSTRERTPPPAPGSLSLNASPWCRAFIGERELGITPIASVEVPAGRHSVRCVHPELGERTVQVNVGEGEDVRRRIAFLGELRFRVVPWAVVHLDGEEIGMTPLPPRQIPSGRHQVRLVNEQLGVDRTMDVEVVGGETATVNVDLR
ncbi:MAG: protein kinase domain-containing protein [Myxococcota bacterium]